MEVPSKGCKINYFGFGTLKNIKKDIRTRVDRCYNHLIGLRNKVLVTLFVDNKTRSKCFIFTFNSFTNYFYEIYLALNIISSNSIFNSSALAN